MNRIVVFAAALLFAGALNAQDSAEREVRKAMDDNFAAILHKDGDALNRQYSNDYFRIDDTARYRARQSTLPVS